MAAAYHGSETWAMSEPRPSRMNRVPFRPGPAGPEDDPGRGPNLSLQPSPARSHPLLMASEEVTAPDSHIRPELIDELMELYVEWREDCNSLRSAYRRWLSGPADDRDLAFAAYRAALDREEQAGIAYANRFGQIARGGRPGSGLVPTTSDRSSHAPTPTTPTPPQAHHESKLSHSSQDYGSAD